MATSSQLQPVNLAPNRLCSPRSSNCGQNAWWCPTRSLAHRLCCRQFLSQPHPWQYSGSCTRISAGAPPTGSSCSILLFEGIAGSRHKTYQSALCCFAVFSSMLNISSPFPVSQVILRYFLFLHLSPQDISCGYSFHADHPWSHGT